MAIRLIRQIGILCQILRWPNLIMVVSCLFLFHQFLKGYNPELALEGLDFVLFIWVVLLITASGYLINDHFDRETDRINKPYRIARYNAILPLTAWRLYTIFTSMGAILAFWIAGHLSRWHTFLLYPLAVALLYGYAQSLKGSALFGNMLVAAMTAVVPFVLLIPEWHWIQEANLDISHPILSIFFGFAVFSFGVSLFREMIKDLEDVQGDTEAGWMTIPVRYGQQCAKKVAKCMGYFILALLFVTPFFAPISALTTSIFIIATLVMIVLLISLERAQVPAQFHLISQGAKILLVIGLLAVVSL